jgi:hypothetical protein
VCVNGISFLFRFEKAGLFTGGAHDTGTAAEMKQNLPLRTRGFAAD